MIFRGKPRSEKVIGQCWCGGNAVRVEFTDDDFYVTCAEDIFHEVPDEVQ